jgi:hypothetical protein
VEKAVGAVDEWETLTPAERKELLRSLCRTLKVHYQGRQTDIEVDVTWLA